MGKQLHARIQKDKLGGVLPGESLRLVDVDHSPLVIVREGHQLDTESLGDHRRCKMSAATGRHRPDDVPFGCKRRENDQGNLVSREWSRVGVFGMEEFPCPCLRLTRDQAYLLLIRVIPDRRGALSFRGDAVTHGNVAGERVSDVFGHQVLAGNKVECSCQFSFMLCDEVENFHKGTRQFKVCSIGTFSEVLGRL